MRQRFVFPTDQAGALTHLSLIKEPNPDRQYSVREGGGRFLGKIMASLDPTIFVAADEHLRLICGAARLQRVTAPIKRYARHGAGSCHMIGP